MSARAVAFVRALPDHQLLDRIVRGRAWIALLGVMLAGIVALQVEQLKLGADIGRRIEAVSSLQSHNELLRARVAALSSTQRIEQEAARMGMVMASPTGVRFLTARPGDAGRAAAGIRTPNPAAYLAALQATSASQSGAAASPSVTATTAGTTATAGATAAGASATAGTTATTGTTGTAATPTTGTTGTAPAPITPPSGNTSATTTGTAGAGGTGGAGVG